MTSAAYLSEVFRFFAGFLLFFAAYGKIKIYQDFRSNLSESFGLSGELSAVFAPGVIAAELLVALLILIGDSGIYFGMIAALVMLCTFTAFISFKFVNDGAVKCNCFGEAARPVSGYDLLRNMILIACISFYLITVDESASLNMETSFLAASLSLILTIIAVEFHEIITLVVDGRE